MPRQFKTARLMKKLSLPEAAEQLGISRVALNAWEIEKKTPSVERVENMADLYGVSTDFLLGRSNSFDLSENKLISPKSLAFMHGKPVWSNKYGWMLVDSVNKKLITDCEHAVSFTDAGELYNNPLPFSESDTPSREPLDRDKLTYGSEIWVEPISMDCNLRQELRGWYRVKHHAIENEAGNRFTLDSYGSKWLAFSDFTE